MVLKSHGALMMNILNMPSVRDEPRVSAPTRVAEETTVDKRSSRNESQPGKCDSSSLMSVLVRSSVSLASPAQRTAPPPPPPSHLFRWSQPMPPMSRITMCLRCAAAARDDAVGDCGPQIERLEAIKLDVSKKLNKNLVRRPVGWSEPGTPDRVGRRRRSASTW